MPTFSTAERFSVRKTARFVSFLVLIFCLVVLSGWAGFMYGRTGRLPSWAPSYIAAALNPQAGTSDKKIDFGQFWQAWNLIDQKFNGNTDPQKRLNGAISGMLAGLKDPYTLYFEPTADSLFRSDLQGSFGGIGAELSLNEGALTVSGTIDGTPAFNAGLRAKDVIIQIDGKKATDFTFAEAILHIRGLKGSTVILQVARAGQDKPLELKIVRDTITVQSVKTESIGVGSTIAYIRVTQFGQDTANGFKAALQAAKDSGKKGLVVDLRNNPGGYVDAAMRMIGMVIPNQPNGDQAHLKNRTALLERHKDGSESDKTTDEPAILDTLPLTVLVNSGSASAAEIFTGAMKDYKRGTVVGSKTFGKGSEQELAQLDNGGSIKVTIAKWFTPLGVGIDGTGLQPDVAIDLPADAQLNSSDVQVARALEILSAKKP